jgi:two-component system response regulator TtrR
MMSVSQTVTVVDDEHHMRDSLVWMLRTRGFQVEAFSSPREILDFQAPDIPGCLVADYQLPGMSGLELQRELRHRGSRRPFIIITGHGEVHSAVDSMREGAIDFILKPFEQHQFLNRVREALRQDLDQRRRRKESSRLRERIDRLTPREREVMDLVVEGRLTKQIAQQLGISVKTVEVHRSHVTKKMEVSSVAQLVRLVVEFAEANCDQSGRFDQHERAPVPCEESTLVS